MVFNSVVFGLFLILVLIGYHSLKWRYQNYLLLLSSYVFYGYWDWRFLFLIFISTIVDYYCGIYIESSISKKSRKLFLSFSIIANIGILGFFKYFNFFIDSAVSLLSGLGLKSNIPLLNIILPVGISFYTFQTLSYSIDIYRKQLKPTRDFLTFALYVAYFPQLVAGPIERATRLLPQLLSSRVVSWPQIGIGIELILIGFLKKVGIADTLSPLVDSRFQFSNHAVWSDLILSVYLFSIQIYCDFSGYSDIARGVSKLFGIELMRNFEQPYLSNNISDFWRRWHISLSTWFKDYFYIPLGGNREGVIKTYRNLMLTMIVCGLWHGANWTFVAWGGLHGFYLIIHRSIFRSDVNPIIKNPVINNLKSFCKTIYTFQLVAFGWILFRCDNITHFKNFLWGILSLQNGTDALTKLSWVSPKIILLVMLLFTIDLIQKRTGKHAIFLNKNFILRGVAYAGLTIAIFLLGGIDVQVPFIYFQF